MHPSPHRHTNKNANGDSDTANRDTGSNGNALPHPADNSLCHADGHGNADRRHKIRRYAHKDRHCHGDKDTYAGIHTNQHANAARHAHDDSTDSHADAVTADSHADGAADSYAAPDRHTNADPDGDGSITHADPDQQRMTGRGALIGLFDSGIGGLSIWQAVQQALPEASLLYVADQAHCPYGERSRAEITARAFAITAFLQAAGAHLIVVACNTATAAALDALRQHWPSYPFVGIEPAVKPAALDSHSRQIAVLATRSTLQAPRFHRLVDRFGREVTLHYVVGEGLVELVEEGELDGPAVRRQLRTLLAPLPPDIDEVVLGCTHYPFLRPALAKMLSPGVRIVDPAPAVARRVHSLWQQMALPATIAPATWRFLTTGVEEPFRRLVTRLVGSAFPGHDVHIGAVTIR